MKETAENHGKNAPISCPFCGGYLTIEDETQEYVNCPFCGGKSLLSDLMGDTQSVMAERERQKKIDEDLQRYLESERENTRLQKQAEKRRLNILKRAVAAVLAPVLAIVLFRMFFLKFGNKVAEILPAPEHGTFVPGYRPDTWLDWSSIKMGNHLPQPENPEGKWRKFNENRVLVNLGHIDRLDFTRYEIQCSDMGYVRERIPSAKWVAFDEEGYRLKLLHRESTEQLEMELTAPIPLKPFSWDKYEFAQLIPLPDTDVGYEYFFLNKTLHIFVGDMDREKVKEYCSLLEQEGFEKYDFILFDFNAEDSRGVQVSASYYGNSIMELLISAEHAEIG